MIPHPCSNSSVELSFTVLVGLFDTLSARRGLGLLYWLIPGPAAAQHGCIVAVELWNETAANQDWADLRSVAFSSLQVGKDGEWCSSLSRLSLFLSLSRLRQDAMMAHVRSLSLT